MIMVDILGVQVYIGFIAFGIAMLCFIAIMVAGEIDNKRAGK
jgi:hypothetical protein